MVCRSHLPTRLVVGRSGVSSILSLILLLFDDFLYNLMDKSVIAQSLSYLAYGKAVTLGATTKQN